MDQRERLKMQCAYANGASVVDLAAQYRMEPATVAHILFSCVLVPRKGDMRWALEREADREPESEAARKRAARHATREAQIEALAASMGVEAPANTPDALRTLKREAMASGVVQPRTQQDALWLRIWRFYQANNRPPLAELAKAMSTSVATCNRALRWFDPKRQKQPVDSNMERAIVHYVMGHSARDTSHSFGIGWFELVRCLRDQGVLRPEDVPSSAKEEA